MGIWLQKERTSQNQNPISTPFADSTMVPEVHPTSNDGNIANWSTVHKESMGFLRVFLGPTRYSNWKYQLGGVYRLHPLTSRDSQTKVVAAVLACGPTITSIKETQSDLGPKKIMS
jgi:hypothetical protein